MPGPSQSSRFTFNVHLAQFDVAPTRTCARISLIWTQVSFINIISQFFINVLFIFILIFDLILILLKNNLNGNKNNFGTADTVLNSYRETDIVTRTTKQIPDIYYV